MIAGFVVYLIAIVLLTVRTRARTISARESISISEAHDWPLNDSERWEEPYFARMRARTAAGRRPLWPVIRALLSSALGLVFWHWFNDMSVLAGIGVSVFVFQGLLFTRQARYYARLNLQGTSVALRDDPRPPVLFLRSFSLDEIPPPTPSATTGEASSISSRWDR